MPRSLLLALMPGDRRVRSRRAAYERLRWHHDGEGVRLNDPAFAALADDVHRAIEAGAVAAIRPAVTHPRLAAHALVALARLPRVRVRVTRSVQGDAIAARLRTRSHGVPVHLLAQGVLTVPADPAAHLAGRSRRGVRASVRRAAALGITTPRVAADEGRAAHEHVRSQRRRSVQVASDDWPVPAEIMTWFVARGADLEPIAVFGLVQDDEVALLKVLHADPAHPWSSPARNALHQAAVEHLAASGVRRLIGDSPLRVTGGVREFMQHLGYRAANLRIERAPR